MADHPILHQVDSRFNDADLKSSKYMSSSYGSEPRSNKDVDLDTIQKANPVDFFLDLAITPCDLAFEAKTLLLTRLASSTRQELNRYPICDHRRLFIEKEAISNLQSWVLFANRSNSDLVVAIASLQVLNLIPWTITELQEYKLGKTLKRASALKVKSEKFESGLKQLFSLIQSMISSQVNSNPKDSNPITLIKDDREKIKSTNFKSGRDTLKTGGESAFKFNGVGGIINEKVDQHLASTSYRGNNSLSKLSSIQLGSNNGDNQKLLNSVVTSSVANSASNVNTSSYLTNSTNLSIEAIPFDPFETHPKINKKPTSIAQPTQAISTPFLSGTQSADLESSCSKGAERPDPSCLDVYVEIVTLRKLHTSSLDQHIKKKKKVNFRSDDQLVRVRFFELDPTERKNPNFNPSLAFGDTNEEEEALFSSRIKESEDAYHPYTSVNSLSSNMELCIPWKDPKPLQFNEHYTLVSGSNSAEWIKQQNKEKQISSPYKCTDIPKCPLNPHESHSTHSANEAPRIIPLYPVSSNQTPNALKSDSIDEHALDSLLGSFSTSKKLFDQSSETSFVDQGYHYQPNYPSYSPPAPMYSQPSFSYPINDYAQYSTMPLPSPQNNLFLGGSVIASSNLANPPSQSLQNNVKMKQVNCPPEKLRRVRCHYYEPSNLSSCAKGSNCTFLHQ